MTSVKFFGGAVVALACIGICTAYAPHDLEFSEPVAPVRIHYGSLDAKAVKSMFKEFTKEYGKKYASSEEEEKRLKIFSENLNRYDEMNEHEKGTAVYGIDSFSDMTVEEFKKKMLSANLKAYTDNLGEKYDDSHLRNVKIPKNFDWREKGAVTPIKNQGQCGSCWAFSAVCNVEGLYFNKYKKLFNLSEQQIVDCDKSSFGCNGGWMENAINYTRDAGGLQDALSYPYVGEDQVCAFDASKVVAKVKKNVNLPLNEKKMAKYLFENGPISIALDAYALGGYKGGIAHPDERFCAKDPAAANHGIALVGYGVAVVKINGKKKRIPYWIAKNSWGIENNDKGYWYVYRGDNTCGIANYPSSAELL